MKSIILLVVEMHLKLAATLFRLENNEPVSLSRKVVDDLVLIAN